MSSNQKPQSVVSVLQQPDPYYGREQISSLHQMITHFSLRSELPLSSSSSDTANVDGTNPTDNDDELCG